MRLDLRVAAVGLLALALAGCTAVGAAPGWLIALLSVSMLAACASPSSGGGGTVITDGTAQDGGSDTAVGGDTGQGDSGAADAGATDVKQGSDSSSADAGDDDVAADAGSTLDAADTTTADSSDAGGTWETCCENGKISTCFCPAGAVCNYGWFTKCGDETCVGGGQTCPGDPDVPDTNVPDTSKPDVTQPDADVPDTYTPDTNVPDTTKPDVTQPDAGKSDVGDAGGTWQKCCKNGHIDLCFCPNGMACNYGWYKDCGDGACVMPTQSCPP